jgi:superfamily II DNA or RNA helicase
MIGLFDEPIATAEPEIIVADSRFAHVLEMPFNGRLTLRDYQREDVLATIEAWNGGARGVVGKVATGLGKSVEIAELARRMSSLGRVLVVVDVGTLAEDLARTIYKHTGRTVGILTGRIKDEWQNAEIIVATVQTLYSGPEGEKWYNSIPPSSISACLIDEAESSLAIGYHKAIRYFLDGNPDIVIAGLTATPRRGDGQGMKKLYDFANQEMGPLHRDIRWGIDNGWIVNLRQAFVRVSVDFSQLKLAKSADGECKDYTDEGLLKLFEEEKALVELAKGIYEVSKDRPSMVICPNSTEFADTLARWLNVEQRGYAMSCHGKQGARADDIISDYKKCNFPCIVSVNKLYKGFDADRVVMVHMVRKTKSPRLVEQAAGRAVRPPMECRDALEAAVDAAERRMILANGPKPYAVFVDLVGLDANTKDISAVDILNGDKSAEVRERAKKKMMATVGDQDTDKAVFEATEEERKAQADAARKEEARKQRRYNRLQAPKGTVDIEYTDDLRASRTRQMNDTMTDPATRHIPTGIRKSLAQNKVPAEVMAKMSVQQAVDLHKMIIQRHSAGLCSYAQAKLLRSKGYTKPEVHVMTRQDASAAIEAIKANGWKRP